MRPVLSGRRQRLLANAVAFQLGWPVCVLAGSAWAVAAVGAYLVIHFAWVSRIPGEWRAIGAVAAIGIAVDVLSLQAGLFRVPGGGFPLWLAALWLLFATTLNHCLAWLRGRWMLAALLGSLGGTASYVAGVRLGAASFGAIPVVSIVVWLVLWFVMFPALMVLSHRLAGGDRYVGVQTKRAALDGRNRGGATGGRGPRR